MDFIKQNINCHKIRAALNIIAEGDGDGWDMLYLMDSK